MTQPNFKFQEEYSAKLPALALLTNLGWQFLSQTEALNARGGKYDQVVLKDVLRAELAKRTFDYGRDRHTLSKKSIDTIVHELTTPALNEGLVSANEKLYNHMLYGISVTEFIDGKKVSKTIPIIDWHDISNNSFLMTEEMSITRVNSTQTRRPDIVCFVNGLPLVVIEAKRPDAKTNKGPTVDEGISQSIRNQKNDEIPTLYTYSQVLLSINGMDGRYGTCNTPAKFWAAWREEDITDPEFYSLKNKKLSATQIDTLFSHRPPQDKDWYTNLIQTGELAVTGQDKLLVSLLKPQRLLDMMRYFTLFDQKAGKIVARYQQVFGIKRLIKRINLKRPDGGREGGVVWHTTGSGKSFTMVFLSKALILEESLKQCRILVVTDRVDLESQLSKTFASGGAITGQKDMDTALATSGKRLAEQIGSGNERIIFSLIQKFNSATKLPECKNTSADLIVLIDEGHRSQGGENNIRMKQAMPNASYIAFTGTPLLKDDKTTNKFGPIVHAYTMQRAVEDQTVTPLLYEERKPDLDVHERAIDAWFDRITNGITEKQKADLKRKLASKRHIFGSEDRIKLIALDIANHFNSNITNGLKGQVACESKPMAIKYKKYLDEAGLFESVLVMSAPDSREGNTAVDDEAMDEINLWWKQNVGNQDEKSYTKDCINRFDKDDNVKLLIVVDKLLTGFDEPKNAVLYIDKPLREHNLIQAIARVNRLHPLKKFGLLIDYRGILPELDTTIEKYQDLATRTQAGYEIDDLKGLYSEMGLEYRKLPQLYKALWAIFAKVKNKNDIEQLRMVLVPKIQERDGKLEDTNLKVRNDFYDALSAFANCLKIALQSAKFFEDTQFTEEDRQNYKETLKQFSNLRQLTMQDAGETIDFDEYALQVRKLLDKHVVGIGIAEPDGIYEVGKMGVQPLAPEEWSEEKTRNETDIIKTKVTKMIEQELQNDPYAQETFSALLKKAIEEAELLFEHPMKQYMLFKEFNEQVKNRDLPDFPEAVKGNYAVQSYFGIFKDTIADTKLKLVEDDWVELAFIVETSVNTAVAENSVNPDNIDAEIRKALLPKVFQQAKKSGEGMDAAKVIIEKIIQVTHTGFN